VTWSGLRWVRSGLLLVVTARGRRWVLIATAVLAVVWMAVSLIGAPGAGASSLRYSQTTTTEVEATTTTEADTTTTSDAPSGAAVDAAMIAEGIDSSAAVRTLLLGVGVLLFISGASFFVRALR
jgi:hypothetical protein